MLFLWLGIFIFSLAVLIKSADWFTAAAEKIGEAFRVSPFMIGITIVSVGTSLPELATSLIGLWQGDSTIAIANAVGSNIANILLVVGVAAIVGGALKVNRSLIDIDLPLLLGVTLLATFMLWDGDMIWQEGLVAILFYIVYIFYSAKISEKRDYIPFVNRFHLERKIHHIKIPWSAMGILGLGAIGVYFGADWTVKATLKIAEILQVNSSAVVMSALAVGTSLPELIVSASAAFKGKYEIALGNVFGSNIFNLLIVVGVPALFAPLTVDENSLIIGLPVMVLATIIYTFSGISQKINKWEGMIYIFLYFIFVVKLFKLF